MFEFGLPPAPLPTHFLSLPHPSQMMLHYHEGGHLPENPASWPGSLQGTCWNVTLVPAKVFGKGDQAQTGGTDGRRGSSKATPAAEGLAVRVRTLPRGVRSAGTPYPRHVG